MDNLDALLLFAILSGAAFGVLIGLFILAVRKLR